MLGSGTDLNAALAGLDLADALARKRKQERSLTHSHMHRLVSAVSKNAYVKGGCEKEKVLF